MRPWMMVLASLKHTQMDATLLANKIIIILLVTLLVGPRKCLKQIIQITLNKVKNPNWPETNQLAVYKRGRSGFERHKSSKRSVRDLN